MPTRMKMAARVERVHYLQDQGLSPRAIAKREGLTLAQVQYALARPLPEPTIAVSGSSGVRNIEAKARALMGTMADAAVAERIGRSREWVTRARRALEIPAEYGRAKYAREAAKRRQFTPCEGAGLVETESLRAEVRRRVADGARTAQIAFEVGAPKQRVRELVAGAPMATTWNSLVATLEEHGPLAHADLARLWRPRPWRWTGGYVTWGWLARDSEGRYAPTGEGPTRK